ncbi:hypothetical protein QTP88_016171 [Uroleucon formosanum]
MSEKKKITNPNKYLLRKQIYKKFQIVQKKHRSLQMFKSLVTDTLNNIEVELFSGMADCSLCSQFLVMTARKSCCEPCFTKWINDADFDDEIIECRVCNRSIKTVLSDSEFKLLCEQIDVKEKKIKRNGHFGYPVLNQAAMDQLFEDIRSKSVPN